MADSSSPARSARLVAATVAVAAATGRGWSSSSSTSMTSVVTIPSSSVEVVQVTSDSTTGAVVAVASDSSTLMVVLPASSPGSPTSPTSVLRVAPLTIYKYVIVPTGLRRYPRHRQYVGILIMNYAQMKTVFTPRFVCRARLFLPNLLVRAIDFIVENKEEYAEYRKLQLAERRN
ncbi:hypothetical protein QYE76_034789 [Lolium multiflorum]|uniref:Uncharacterized protein n=1 Tax=Lolium multiflorum TaxID=4521 RepID=A0AAD8QYG2_LOLMU|nr:hypothetical protein QYE76_034789 [Lolium multiflorum]